MTEKILIADDDVRLTTSVEEILRQAGYAPLAAHTAEDGLHLTITQAPALAILDVMIPRMGGWEMCQRLRAFSDIPVIFLTALGDVDDVVRGLEMGADDYLVKPFREAELLARIKAHLRRAPDAQTTQQTLTFGQDELIIDLLARTVRVAGEVVELTPREFDLLAALAREAGRVLTKRELLRNAWDMDNKEAQRNLKPYIHYLRKKIERDPAAPDWIETVRGVGYRFAGNNI
ncbi:MAG TPA: response regulator transcription factor [Candidatus Sulfomarinibacteraceae bacterium]|nr:response regulator transcription factor [Candidatus Sulfomarinibacteraceae bacterium]